MVTSNSRKSPVVKSSRDLSPAKDRRRDPSSATVASRNPALADPSAWLASIQGVKKTARRAVAPSATEATTKPIKQPVNGEKPDVVMQPAAEIASKAVQQPNHKAAPKASQQPTSEDGSVSVAFLMSLGIKFSQEQLHALTAQIQQGTDATVTSITNDTKITESALAKGQTSATIAKSSVAKSEESTETLDAQDQTVTNIVQKSGANDQNGPEPSPAQEQTVPAMINPFAAKPHGEKLAIATSRSDMLRRQREMIIGTQVYKNRFSHAAGSLVDSFQKMTLTDFNLAPPPTTKAQPTVHSNAMTPPALSAPKTTANVPTPTVSKAPAAAVPPMVSKDPSIAPVPMTFKAPITAPAPKSSQAPAAAPAPTVSQPPPAAPALRPRFIPDTPMPSVTVTAPAALTSRTETAPLAVSNPFGPARRNRPGGPSLPPHLMGKVASSDPGAAARAQYGGK